MKLVKALLIFVLCASIALPVEASPKVIFYEDFSVYKIPGKKPLSPIVAIDAQIESLVKKNAQSERTLFDLENKLKAEETQLEKTKQKLHESVQLIESGNLVMQIFRATGDNIAYLEEKNLELSRIEDKIEALREDITKEQELISSNKEKISSLFSEREKYFVQQVPIIEEEDLGPIVKELEDVAKVVAATSELIWPLKDYGPEWITSNYGIRDVHPITKKQNVMHNGIDIAIPIYRWPGSDSYNGAPVFVLAAGDGVAYTYESTGAYGNYIIIVHGKYTTLYAHTHEILIDNGQEVRMGEPIAVVGSTGMSTNPHLHFEVRINGEPVDPLEHVQRALVVDP